MPVAPKAPLEAIIELCDKLHARDGFVKWADVGKALGVSRQAIQLRLRAAVERGELSPERVEAWQSMTSRAAASRERRKQSIAKSREVDKAILRVRLTPENLAWIRSESVLRKSTSTDIINGLINVARLSS